MKNKIHTGTLRHHELEALYAISRVVADTVDIGVALEEITKITREVFIFDNAVIYTGKDEKKLEPIFARAVGRGRSHEADMAWGEVAAKEVIKTGQNYLYQSVIDPLGNRLDQHFFLGLPMLVSGKATGALVFIRFGGPVFSEEQVNLSEFIATHISHLYEREKLVEKVADLEADRRLNLLQDNFIDMVSHDLNTPLGFIKGYTTTLLREDTEWDEAAKKEFLSIIDEETDRLSDLIENLLDSSRLQDQTLPMEFEIVNIDGLTKTHIERLQFIYPNLEMNVDVKEKNIRAKVDPKRFSQVLDNIINNATKYAPHSKVNVKIDNNDSEIIIKIEDDGPGIDPKHLANLFDRFYRVGDQGDGVRGSGLGLYICKQIIHAHNGKISVESDIDEGTCFTILLPIAET
ncbi:MAG: hypothetical protein HON98_07245 [Chloroflexi bacterium]|jgi:K+-sensing histidine kinase KdpD|nr:hypothetical protein [Chloroflexota bacterium]MBT3669738.1 hypothetical protein [Chloroflexota bacterium]MBT4003428.1 hypothetical protein [Chloroflexota bacterium]MBT4305218.1 hypothetical protein [Chloroflexota bacterium]MBT4534859.1 hypothetical protein [Chloroflexota bacterium]